MAESAKNTQRIDDLTGNSITYIQPDVIDTDNFSLHLFGKKVSDLSESLNNNFIALTQNFYGLTQPQTPINGQYWINASDNLTYRWLDKNWIQVDKDNTYDSFMYIMYDIGETTEFVLDEFVFNFTIENIVMFNQNMNLVKFIIDPFDSRKIILKESNITSLYIMVFHPQDRITNPLKNKKIEFFCMSGQTQFDVGSLTDGNNINTLSVALNGTMLKNNEFSIVNNILTINGLFYRVRKNDKLTVWLHGGSLNSYYSNLKIHTNKRESSLKIPKIFKDVMNIEILDLDEKAAINPIEIKDLDNYLEFEFLDKKNIDVSLQIRII